MGAAVALRTDFSASELRQLAKRAEDADQARRLLPLAAALDGMSRKDAAAIGAMDRQTLCDWAHRFNEKGPAGCSCCFKKDTNERRLIDINNLILTVLAIVGVDLQRKGVEVQTELSTELPAIAGDKVQLQQVVLNLVMNAIEAVHSVQHRVLTVQSELTKPEMVHLSIKDTGTGVDPSNLDRIFKPLFTTKMRGMGMGLSICHSIIESHGGRIWFSPGVNGGSIFQFELQAMSVKERAGTMAVASME